MSTAGTVVPEPPATLDGLGQVAALTRDGFNALRATPWPLRCLVVWELWLVATVGDAGSTLLALHRASLHEGNPSAAYGFGLLGSTGYVLVASALCALMAVASAGQPRGPVARVALGFLLLVAVTKIVLAYHNLLLWQSS